MLDAEHQDAFSFGVSVDTQERTFSVGFQLSEMVSFEWFKALNEEDCKRVRYLLRAQSSLLGEGLREYHRRVVEGTSTWKALHVGARRGSVQFVTVLGMYDNGFKEDICLVDP